MGGVITMRKYAMILNSVVIDIVLASVPPKYPPDPEGVGISAIECGSHVKIGMIYNDTSQSFEEYVYPVDEKHEVQFTDNQIIMQAMADAELRDMQIQQGQEMLAQQMTDIELAVLGGGTTV